MGRIRAGWALTKKSWAVLEGNRTLIRFPLYGAVATILMGVIVVGPGLYLIDQGSKGGGIALAIIGFYILAVIGFYFSVALAAAADMIFRGQQPTVSDGLDVARSRFRAIAGWAALSTVVGVVLSILEESGIIGQILGRLLDIGWSLLTFLAVPVIAIEGTGPIDTFKRSAGIFRSKWGQQLTGNLAIGGLVFLLGILPAGLLIVAGIALWSSSGFGGALLVIVGAIVGAIALLISKALSGIFGVALYRYATGGEPVGGFTLRSSSQRFGGRRARRLRGRPEPAVEAPTSRAHDQQVDHHASWNGASVRLMTSPSPMPELDDRPDHVAREDERREPRPEADDEQDSADDLDDADRVDERIGGRQAVVAEGVDLARVVRELADPEDDEDRAGDDPAGEREIGLPARTSGRRREAL